MAMFGGVIECRKARTSAGCAWQSLGLCIGLCRRGVHLAANHSFNYHAFLHRRGVREATTRICLTPPAPEISVGNFLALKFDDRHVAQSPLIYIIMRWSGVGIYYAGPVKVTDYKTPR
jgi:hypothetical protein